MSYSGPPRQPISRDEYLDSLTTREYHGLGLKGIPYTREDYLQYHLLAIHDACPPCPNANLDMIEPKGSIWAGSRTECTRCGFTISHN